MREPENNSVATRILLEKDSPPVAVRNAKSGTLVFSPDDWPTVPNCSTCNLENGGTLKVNRYTRGTAYPAILFLCPDCLEHEVRL